MINQLKKYQYLLLIILFLKACLFFWWISTYPIGLAPDEAQYWTWSKLLDWGYYSKPPAVAWQIWLGTQLFGDNELGVRFSAILIAFLFPLAIFYLARACLLTPRSSFWAALVFAFSPLGIFSSLLATTDGGMLLFWTLACAVFLSSQNYPLIALIILCGALFKWPIYLLWIPILIYGTKNKQLLIAIFISLLGLFPSMIWNYSHGWVTFRHVFTQTVGGVTSSGNFFDFLGAQGALVSPILFVMLIISFVGMIKDYKKISSSLLFCGGLSLTILTIFLTLSLFKKIQGNWCLYAYPTAFVYLTWYATERLSNGLKWLKAGMGLSIFLSAAVLSIPHIPFPYKSNPFKHNLGWSALGEELANAGYDPEKHFLLGDRYQMTSLLSFYAPGQKRAYFMNLHGARKNQFSFWPRMKDEQRGNSGYFVTVENIPNLEKDPEGRIAHYQEELQKYFTQVKFLGIKPLYIVSGRVVKGAFIFLCTGYNGLEPEDPELY
jgi:4-amino-4-deoxy-L-arabinose transferase-like glycosyltransferase